MKPLLQYFREHRKLTALLLTLPWLLASLGVILYYIFGPSVGYFHSDCADSLLWANASLESGRVFSEEFSYAALLPFGSTIWMVPIIAIFGLTMRAQLISMAIFAILYCAASIFFFRSLKWSYPTSAAATFALMMLLSSSVKLREIMWEHTIYYSLGSLLFLLLLGLLFRTLDAETEKGKRSRFIIWSVLLFLVAVGCGTDGFQMLVLTVVPALGALVIETLTDETPLLATKNYKKYLSVFLIFVGTVVGLGLLLVMTKFGTIGAGYENAYSQWSAVSAWWTNAENFISQWFTLFGVDVTREALFSMKSFLYMIRLVVGVALLICPIILLLRYKKIEDRATRLAILAHAILTLAVMFGFICGMLSNASWRLTPLLASCIVATCLYVKELFRCGTVVSKRFSVLFGAVILAGALLSARTIVSMPADYGRDDSFYDVIAELEERGLNYGYATFWNAGKTTLLSNGKVVVRNIDVTTDGVKPYYYQSSRSWFEDREGQDSYFLLLTSAEYQTFIYSAYGNRMFAERILLGHYQVGGYHILEFNGNVFLPNE